MLLNFNVKHYILLSFLSIFSPLTKAEPPTIEQISTQQGLSQNTVRSIIQDRKGFMWFGTINGLNRYDGYRFVIYKPEPGKKNTLSDNRIKELFEDKFGNIWIKTFSNKFSCFDPSAETFQNFPTQALSSDTTFDGLFITKSGNIWLSSYKNGCVFLVHQTNQWLSKVYLSHHEGGQSISNNRINSLFEDSEENIWLCTRTGLSFISKASISDQSFTVKNYYNGPAGIDFAQVYQIGNMLYFISRGSGVFSYNLIKKTFTKSEGFASPNVFSYAILNPDEILLGTTDIGLLTYNCTTNKISKSNYKIDDRSDYVTQILSDRCGGIWVSNSTGNIWRIDSIKRTMNKFVLIPKELTGTIDNERFNLHKDDKNNVWISTYGGGLYCFNNTDKSLKRFVYEPGRSNVLSSNYILSIYHDRSGIIWAGTENTGINKLSFQDNKFQTIFPTPNASYISSNSVRAIFEDKSGTIWVSTKDGKLHFYDANLNVLPSKFPFFKNVNFNGNIYCFFQDNQGFMWLGTKGDGVSYFDPQKTNPSIQKFKFDYNNPKSLSNNQIYDILQDAKDRIWIATFGGGLNLVVRNGNENISFKRFFNNERSFNQIRCLRLDKNGNIWVGTSNGVLVFNPDNLIQNPDNYKSFNSRNEQKNSISSNEVKAIYQDKSGNIWVGTSGGLNKYIGATKNSPEHFELYSIKQGLSNEIIQGIIEDDNGNLWVGTESGISRYNIKNNSFENFRVSGNILGNIISEAACFKRKSGDMLWGCSNGFYAFSPKEFSLGVKATPVVLTNFSISGNPVEINAPGSPLTKSITFTNEITLDNSQHSFSIEFATLLFNDQQRNQYSYILEKYETGWNKLVNYNIATYSNLPPGKYIFKVKLANDLNSPDAKITQLKITVLPPFWKSKFALMLYVVIIFLLIFSTKLVIQRIHKLQGVIDLEKQITDYKVKFFTNISHEFRTPLFLIQGSMEALLEGIKLPPQEKKHFQVMQRNTNRLLMLIEQLLDFSKVQNKSFKLNLVETNVVEFLKDIYNSFSDLAEKKQIHYHFSSNLEQILLTIDQAILDKIVYNLLSNAFKFTPQLGTINFDVLIDPQAQQLAITITDTGSGIPQEKQALIFTRFAQIQPTTTGIGLSLARELADLHKGKIEFESTPGAGSVFRVTIQTKPELYNSEDFAVSSEATEHQRLPVIDQEDEPIFNKDVKALNDTKLLIIEDNPEIRDYLLTYFSKYFEVDEAKDGIEGLNKARETEPDLIVCDIMMPELDGIQVTQKLKGDFQTSHIPIILLTALASSDYELKGTEAGADAYITKPFSIKYLLTKIIKLIEQREKLRQHYTSSPAQENTLLCKDDRDKQFMEKAYKIAEENITNPEFSVDEFAKLAGFGRTVFFKKIKGITGYSPNEYMRVVRMKKALELLQTGQFTVSEISYKVGISDPFYFSRCFKAQFGHSPSAYLKK
jgi:signal transduction histidine kinase/ligand-binding sensor domain-containing protein/DNA-binding response OmpR family regulator